MDIFEDTCAHDSTSSIELDRIKDKIRSVWQQLIHASYEKEYKHQRDDDENYMTLEHYIEHNQLMFSGDEQPEDEVDDILKMLDEMLEPDEELEPVESNGKAPKYGSSSLKSNKESSTVPAGVYNIKHISTKTPSDKRSLAKSTTYDVSKGGKQLTSKTHQRSTGSTQSLDDILKIERERLLRLISKNNKKYGVKI
mgnify:FL=1